MTVPQARRVKGASAVSKKCTSVIEVNTDSDSDASVVAVLIERPAASSSAVSSTLSVASSSKSSSSSSCASSSSSSTMAPSERAVKRARTDFSLEEELDANGDAVNLDDKENMHVENGMSVAGVTAAVSANPEGATADGNDDNVAPAIDADEMSVADDLIVAAFDVKGKGKMETEGVASGINSVAAFDIKGKGKMVTEEATPKVDDVTTFDVKGKGKMVTEEATPKVDATLPLATTFKTKAQAKAALAKQSEAAAQRDTQERLQIMLPYLDFPSKPLGADDFEENDNDDGDEFSDNEDADNSWWWKSFDDEYPGTSTPRPGLLYLSQGMLSLQDNCNKSVQLILQRLSTAAPHLPMEIVCRSEYKLVTRRPILNGVFPCDSETLVTSHPDPARRHDPKLLPRDFPEDKEYVREKALREKKLALEAPNYYALLQRQHRLLVNREIRIVRQHALIAKTGDKPVSIGRWDLNQYVADVHRENPDWHPFLRVFMSKLSQPQTTEVKIFLDCERLREVMERGMPVELPGSLVTILLRRIRSKVPPKYIIPNTLSAPELEPAPGFGLELRSYQKRTLKWLIDLESDASQRTFTALKDCNSYDDIKSLAGETPNAPRPGGESSPPHGDQVSRRYFGVGQEGRKELEVTLLTDYISTFTHRARTSSDDTGTGKTVTVLALVHSNPFKCVPAEVYERLSDPLGYLPSRATLVVCPSHLAQQWKLEAQRCLVPTAKIHLLTTINDYKKMSWDDFLSADLIITSLHFLQNTSYQTHMSKLCDMYKFREADSAAYVYAMRVAGHARFGKRKGEAMLSRILWHRVVSDEFHELGHNKSLKRASAVFLNDLVGCFNLGVTGTPQYSSVEKITSMAQYLGTELPHMEDVCYNFLRMMVRRNEPDLQLPPLIQQSVYVDLTPQERGMCRGLMNGTIDALMACNHHQLAGEILALVGDQQEMTIEEVSRRVQVARQQQIADREQDIVHGQILLQQYRKDLSRLQSLKKRGVETIMKDGEERSVKNEIASIERRLESTKREMTESQRMLVEVRGQYNFFKAVLDTMQGNEEKECPICMDTIGKDDNFVISGCGHVHCVDCMNHRVQAAPGGEKPLCSMCRQEIRREDVMLMNRATMAKQKEKAVVGSGDASADSNQLDCSKYGSKLAAFVEFMRETLAATPTAKFILFIQFKRLTKLVSEALKEFRIEHVRCDGNVHARSKAVREFKTSQNVRLILLSSEDSVSGLHLTEATHMVIFHPFLIPGNDALAVSYEKQGIARAWRGGLDHPVQLVRFIAKDSIEEMLAKERGYVDGVVTELDGCVKKGEGSGGNKSGAKV